MAEACSWQSILNLPFCWSHSLETSRWIFWASCCSADRCLSCNRAYEDTLKTSGPWERWEREKSPGGWIWVDHPRGDFQAKSDSFPSDEGAAPWSWRPFHRAKRPLGWALPKTSWRSTTKDGQVFIDLRNLPPKELKLFTCYPRKSWFSRICPEIVNETSSSGRHPHFPLAVEVQWISQEKSARRRSPWVFCRECLGGKQKDWTLLQIEKLQTGIYWPWLPICHHSDFLSCRTFESRLLRKGIRFNGLLWGILHITVSTASLPKTIKT